MLDTAVSLKYMFAGYTAIFVILIIYLVSLFARWRRLEQDLKMLKEIKKK